MSDRGGTIALRNQRKTTEQPTVELSPAMRAALDLWTTASISSDASADPWAAAVGMEQLLQVGLTECDLRWLVAKGFVRHARKIALPGRVAAPRATYTFRPGRNLAFAGQTCFLLTEAGAALAAGHDVIAVPTGTAVITSDDGDGREERIAFPSARITHAPPRRKAA